MVISRCIFNSWFQAKVSFHELRFGQSSSSLGKAVRVWGSSSKWCGFGEGSRLKLFYDVNVGGGVLSLVLVAILDFGGGVSLLSSHTRLSRSQGIFGVRFRGKHFRVYIVGVIPKIRMGNILAQPKVRMGDILAQAKSA